MSGVAPTILDFGRIVLNLISLGLIGFITKTNAVDITFIGLTITKMDGGDISFDCQSLKVAGTISVTVDNIGPSDTGSGVTVLLFVVPLSSCTW